MSGFVKTVRMGVVGALLNLSLAGFGADEPKDHKAKDDASNAASSQNTPVRKDVLQDGLKEIGLSASALRAVEQLFRLNPDVDSDGFTKLLSRVDKENKGLFEKSQVEDLNRLYRVVLGDGGEKNGQELSEAARAVLKSLKDETAKKKTTLPPIAKADTKPKETFGPEELKKMFASAIKEATEKNAKTAPSEASASSDNGLLSELGVLQALRSLKDEKSDRGDDRDDRLPRLDPGSLANMLSRRDTHRPEAPRSREDSRRPDNRDRERRFGPMMGFNQNGNGRDNTDKPKDEQKKTAEFSPSSSRRKKKAAEEEVAKEETPSDPSSALDPNSLPQVAQEPRKSPLPSIQNGGGDPGMGGPGGMGNPMAGMMGKGGMPGMMGGTGMGGMGGMGMGGSGAGGAGGMADGDPFNVGGGAFPGSDVRMASGFMIAKDGGYSNSGGGGGEEYTVAQADPEAEVEGPMPASVVPRTQVNEQIAQSVPSAVTIFDKTHQLFQHDLCAPDIAKEEIGICQTLDLRRLKQESLAASKGLINS